MTISQSTLAAIRFGYGLSAGADSMYGHKDLIGQLRPAQAQEALFPVGGREQRWDDIRAYHRQLRQINEAKKQTGVDDQEGRKALRREARMLLRADSMARLVQAVTSPYGFHERLASFWINHFVVSASKSPDMLLLTPLFEAEAIRSRLAGRFTDLLTEVSLHPAMLVFLDQARSFGPHSPAGQRRGGEPANENFAREVMELHTLGVDSGYSQKDVQELARLLTGLKIDPKSGKAAFDPRRAEPGSFTILDKTYQRSDEAFADARNVLADLAADPRTMRHVSTRLASHFISETPRAELVDVMVAAWQDTDGDLTSVYAAMLDHPSAWAEPANKVKMPLDYVVSSLRALGADEDMLMRRGVPAAGKNGKAAKAVESLVGGKMSPGAMADRAGAKAIPKDRGGAKPLALQALNALDALGQPVWRASNAAGFDDESSSWLGPSQLAERIAWSRLAVSRLGGGIDPRAFVETALADAARPETVKIAGQAPNRQAGLLVSLVSPEFNRR